MKSLEQYVLVLLFIMLYKVVLTFESVDEILKVTTKMKVTEQYVLVVLFIMLCKIILTFESVDEILKCDHSNKKLLNRNFPAVLLACCSLHCTGCLQL